MQHAKRADGLAAEVAAKLVNLVAQLSELLLQFLQFASQLAVLDPQRFNGRFQARDSLTDA